MNIQDQINNLKAELQEFIEQSKTITQGKWVAGDEGDIVYRQPGKFGLAAGIIVHGRASGVTREQDALDAAFIARSRNISPAMAECLLVAVEGLERTRRGSIGATHHNAGDCIQEILTIWEASK